MILGDNIRRAERPVALQPESNEFQVRVFHEAKCSRGRL
jgi:hypothetical protein